jgi:hypothetical protein
VLPSFVNRLVRLYGLVTIDVYVAAVLETKDTRREEDWVIAPESKNAWGLSLRANITADQPLPAIGPRGIVIVCLT